MQTVGVCCRTLQLLLLRCCAGVQPLPMACLPRGGAQHRRHAPLLLLLLLLLACRLLPRAGVLGTRTAALLPPGLGLWQLPRPRHPAREVPVQQLPGGGLPS